MNNAWLIPTSWWLRGMVGGGVLLLAVWVLTRLTRQPARRQRLGEWGVLAALLAALLSGGPAWLQLRLPMLPNDALPAAVPLLPAPSPDGTETIPSRLSPSGRLDTRDELADAEAAPDMSFPEGGEVSASAPPSESLTPEPRFSWADAWTKLSALFSPNQLAVGLMAVYFLSAMVLIGRWLYGWMMLNRFLRRCVPAPAPAAQLFASLTRHLKKPPRLFVSGQLRVPVSCGLWRPTVVLPAHFVTPADSPRLRWVFAHELTHLERRDPWSCLLFGLAQGVYFYCPWFWWLRRQVRLCQEFIADAAAARQAGVAEDYAQFLVSLAEAPAGPRVAIGVVGHRSDLFRRITMLLQNPLKIENRCPRRWSMTTAAGLFAVAVCAAGIGLAADSEPDKPAQKPQTPAQPKDQAQRIETPRIVVVTQEDEEKPKVVVVGVGDDLGDLRKALDKLPPGPEMDQLKKDILKRIEALKANPALRVHEINGLVTTRRTIAGGVGAQRLGAMIGQPSAALVEQLDLPKGKGVVIRHVVPGLSAAKAGLKDNDILMELDGKTVPSNGREFADMIQDIKSGTPVDAVVLRKGKKEVVKGITLQEGKVGVRAVNPAVRAVPPGAAPAGRGIPGQPNFRPGALPAARGLPVPPPVQVPAVRPIFPAPTAAAVPGLPMPGFGANSVMTSIFRTDDRFTGRHQEGSLIITVTGTMTDGKAKLKEIYVQDGKTGEKYESLSKVPERYRDKAKNLIEMSEKGNVKVESRSGSRQRIEIERKIR